MKTLSLDDAHTGLRERAVRCTVILVLALHAWLVVRLATTTAPTVDEPSHLAAGLFYWEARRFDLYEVNPPLTRLVAAFLPWVAGVPTDWRAINQGRRQTERHELQVGSALVRANGTHFFAILALARCSCLPFSLLGAWICYRWSRDLYGSLSGLVALCLWCFSPDILGHGALVTADVPAAATGVTLGYTFWNWLKLPSWRQSWLVGLAWGTCLLTKSTWVVWAGVGPLIWLLSIARREQSLPLRHQAGQIAFQIVLGVLVLNVGYTFEGVGTPLRGYEFVSASLSGSKGISGNRFRGSAFEHVPVPFPSSFVRGIDFQKRDLESANWPKYLCGECNSSGWWYFYLAAAIIKLSVGTIACIGLGVLRLLAFRRWSDCAILLVVPVALLTVVSIQQGLCYYRYILPAFPFLVIAASSAAQLDSKGSAVLVPATLLFLVSSVASSIACYPHCLAHVNLLFGGWKNCHRYLVDGNTDWGQDLFRLQEWIVKNVGDEPLFVVYHGGVDPRVLEIEYELPKLSGDNRLPPGIYAISASFLHCGGHLSFDGKGGRAAPQREIGQFLEKLPPVANIGGTIFVFRVLP